MRYISFLIRLVYGFPFCSSMVSFLLFHIGIRPVMETPAAVVMREPGYSSSSTVEISYSHQRPPAGSNGWLLERMRDLFRQRRAEG